jgi:hypothetical protein
VLRQLQGSGQIGRLHAEHDSGLQLLSGRGDGLHAQQPLRLGEAQPLTDHLGPDEPVYAAPVHELDLFHQAIHIQLSGGGEGRLGDGKDAAQGFGEAPWACGRYLRYAVAK